MSILKIPPVLLDDSTKKKLFHAIIEKEAVAIGSGMITVNVILKGGVPVLPSINIVKSRRIKYELK